MSYELELYSFIYLYVVIILINLLSDLFQFLLMMKLTTLSNQNFMILNSTTKINYGFRREGKVNTLMPCLAAQLVLIPFA